MKVFVVFVVMIAFTVSANLLMKTGVSTHLNPDSSFLVKLFSWRVILGLLSFGCAAICYLLILSWLPLNVAQSFASAQFVAVIIASWLFLSESIGVLQWIGIALISLGIVVVGWST